MGGIVEGGVGIGTKTYPRRAAIDKAQAELRLEYDIREERRRELEFLEKGGNPLDFNFEITAPLSVQSSSHADQLNDQRGNCEARGGSSAASPLGDSIGSSGRLGAVVTCEPDGADNFDGENEIVESEGKLRYASRSNNTPSEHSSQLGGSQNVRESEDSPTFHPKKAYRRRNRPKTNRDSARLSTIDISSRVGHSSLSDRHRVLSKAVGQESPSDAEMDGSNAADSTAGGLSEGKDISSSKHMHDDSHNQDMRIGVSTAMTSAEPHPCMGVEQKITAASEFLVSGAEKSMDVVGPEQQSEPDLLDGDRKCSQFEASVNGLEPGTSCAQTSPRIDGNGNTNSRICTMKNVDSTGEQMEQKAPLESTENYKIEEILKDSKMADIAESNSCINESHLSQSCQANGCPDKDQEEIEKNHLAAQYEGECIPCDEDKQPDELKDSIVSLRPGSLNDSIQKVESNYPRNGKDLHSQSTHELTKIDGSCTVSVPDLQPCGNQTKVIDKAHEDQILEKARNIMAKHKIFEDLSLGSLPKEYRSKSHWDFVLEEMAWMANDFAQERVWKRTAATQLCYRAAFASRLRFGQRDKLERDKVLARTLAKVVMDFWHSAALLVGVNGNVSGSGTCEHDTATSDNTDGNAKVENGDHNKEYVKMNTRCALQGYAVRFLRLNSPVMPIINDVASQTPDGAFIIGSQEMTYQNQHVEEDLFYVVPHGAMESYRKSVVRHLSQCLRAGKNMQEVNTSMYNAVGEFQCQENEYEEDEGENAYYLPGAFEGSKASKLAQKKRKNPKLYSPRSYEAGGDFSYGHCTENRIRIQQSSFKRPANGLNACPIPTKRVRTASRQRVVGPFSSGAAGFMPLPSRTDASSGDTNSYQDDQSSLNGGSLIAKGLEVESGMDYDKQSTFDCAELTPKPKKKKTKHQRDHFKRRSESHQVDSNSNNDPFVPHSKKPKTIKQSLENSFDNTTSMSGYVASPGGSQMSNMSNPNKLIKLIGGRDRGRKTKSLKMPSVQTGSGCPWSLFEDQALVVLVHDMGPNWELVSDAINSTLHFKCIFRKPQECKERHAILLEKSWGDGADTEDSGSSQPYPSTLPGIPKGGARQLFQQLRGPMEEDTIKSHFEKIILIGQQMHGRKKQELKQLVSVHSSHLAALSQSIPNNVNGGVLTPLDLCDMASSSPDVFSGSYQSPHNGSLPLPNQASGQPMLPSPSTSSSLQGPPGSNMASPSAQVNIPARDGRHGISRANLPIDEQQRIQQYNQLLSSRNIQQTNMSVPGTFSGNDLGGRILPGVNGLSIPRPGNMVGTPSSLNMQPGAGVGQGISMLGPRDALTMRVSHGNNRGVSNFSGLSSSFPSQSASSGPTFSAQHQQYLMHQQHSNALSNSHHPHLQGSPHSGSTTEQQTLARDRQLQQRMLQRQQQKQQHQQFPTQSQATASQPLSLPPLSSSSPVPSQQQQKHQIPRRIPQSAMGGMMNQGGKPRQLQQQLQQSGRHHPPQHQLPPHSQQQAKILKGMGKGNTMMHQHHPVNSSHLNNGLTSNLPGSQLEKGEKSMYQSQSSKPAAPTQSTQFHPQQKLHSNSAPVSLSQVPAVLTSIQSNPPPILPPPNQQSKVHQHPPVKLVNQKQPNINRAVSQSQATNSDPVTERQNDPSQVEQHLANNTVEPANTASEIQSGSLIPNSQLGSTTENEPIVPGAHDLVPKKPPNSLAPSLEIQRKQMQQLQTTLPNQVLPQEKHHLRQQQLIEQSSQRQPLLHQHPQPQVQTPQSNNLTNNSILD